MCWPFPRASADSVNASGRFGSIIIDNFRTLGNRTVNQDGGCLDISADEKHALHGSPSMRLTFTPGRYQCGNAARAVQLTANAVAVDFDVCAHEAQRQAYMAVWLFEADGDGYFSVAGPEGKELSELSKGWHHVSVPISRFRYDTRGNKKREPLTVDKLLMGLGAGKADVFVANVEFHMVHRSTRIGEGKTQNLKIQDGSKGRMRISDLVDQPFRS